MKNALLVVFLVSILTACTHTQPNITDIQNNAATAAWTSVALTLQALPTSTPPPTSTPTAIEYTPSSVPTQPLPPPILTPDAIQVERWKEYQTELAKVIFSVAPSRSERKYTSEDYKDALCEWDILGQSDQEIYIWAACRSVKFFKPYIMGVEGAI